jgi:hypothetical protein
MQHRSGNARVTTHLRLVRFARATALVFCPVDFVLCNIAGWASSKRLVAGWHGERIFDVSSNPREHGRRLYHVQLHKSHRYGPPARTPGCHSSCDRRDISFRLPQLARSYREGKYERLFRPGIAGRLPASGVTLQQQSICSSRRKAGGAPAGLPMSNPVL